MSLEKDLELLITESVEAIGRPDLFREPLVGFSSAHDEHYEQLKTLIGPWHKTPEEFLPSAKSVISFFVPFTKNVVRDPRKAKTVPLSWGEAYQVINKSFGIIGEKVKEYLIDQGYEALTIPATHTYDPEVLQSAWSHRSAGVISGLGTFGINHMVITPKGAGGRFCNVITSAQLQPTGMMEQELCVNKQNGNCGVCMFTCPVDALSFEGFDKFCCQDHLFEVADTLPKDEDGEIADVCGKCISICPLAYIE